MFAAAIRRSPRASDVRRTTLALHQDGRDAAIRGEDAGADVEAAEGPVAEYQEAGERRAHAPIGQDLPHGADVILAGSGRERRMGVPFAKIVEASIIVAGSLVEVPDGLPMVFRVTDKAGGASAVVLEARLQDPELIPTEGFAQEDAADLSLAGLLELPTPRGGDRLRQQDLHGCPW
jgi:hypothetical protein